MQIHGQPQVGSLPTLSDELKTSASSVPTVLGGREFGHLGIPLTDIQYMTLSQIPFVLPTIRGALQQLQQWERLSSW